MRRVHPTWCQTCGQHVAAFSFNGGKWHCSNGNHTIEVDE